MTNWKKIVSLENKVIFSAIKGIVPETSMIVGEHFL
jgi:glycerol-3-phosphate dehydrogenase (NAD(P)+)